MVLAGAIATGLAVLLYLLLFWNRFAGLRSGSGDYYGGLLLAQGYLPYRDFFTATPPFTGIRSALVLLLFGKSYIVSRAFGVFERVLLAVLVYLWLARMFSAGRAALASIATIIVGSGDVADPISSYNHEAILWAVASGLLASFVLDQGHAAHRMLWFSFASGLCAGFSCTTKQTIGIGVTAAVFITVGACLLRLNGFRRSVIFCLVFSLGWAVVIAGLVVWLSSVGILNAFLFDVFQQGPAAKASHSSDFVFRFKHLFGQNLRPAGLALLAVVVAAPAWWRSGRKEKSPPQSIQTVVSVLMAVTAAIALATALSYVGYSPGRQLLTGSIYFVFFSVIAVTPFYFGALIQGRIKQREAQFLLYASVSFAVAFMLSLSWPVFEAMDVPGLGLLIAAALEGYPTSVSRLFYVAAVTLIFFGTVLKLNLPFGFAWYREAPVWQANTPSTLPQMHGFLLPAPVVRLIDGTVQIVDEHSTKADTIFAYPEFGLFYALSGRSCPTMTCSHNIDVVNDDLARAEARRLLDKRPAVLIYYRISERHLKGEEILWRRGKRSGQRDIMEAMETLIRKYQLAGTFYVPPYEEPLVVYVRPQTSPMAVPSQR